MALGMEVGLGPVHIVLDGDAAFPSLERETAPLQFFAHVRCGQTAGWIKMPLGTEVGLDLGHILLDRTRPPPQKRHSSEQPPLFSPCLLWRNGRPSICYNVSSFV